MFFLIFKIPIFKNTKKCHKIVKLSDQKLDFNGSFDRKCYSLHLYRK